MIASDMTQFLDVFLDEGREQLALLESCVLEMERGNHTPEMLQAIFRAAHTLKGSSRAMGFLAIGDLTHEMENVLDDLRHDLLPVSTPIVSALLDCLDALTRMIAAVAAVGTDAEAGLETPALVARLDRLRMESAPPPQSWGAGEEPDMIPAFSSSSSAPFPAPQNWGGGADSDFPLAEHEQESIHAALESGLTVFRIRVTLAADCLMKSVRAWMVLGALEPLGTVLVAHPNEEALEAEAFEQTFTLLFAGETTPGAIENALRAISELEAVTVQALPPPISAEQPERDEPVAAEPSPAAGTSAAAATHSQTIRVEVARLDSLLNLVGELVIERAQMTRIGGELNRRYPRDGDAAKLQEATHHLARITSELQDQIMKTRMLPIDGVFQRMPRMVRDLALKTGKDVDFRLTGGETELDRTVLEALGDPLIHLLRNSVDHGIELPEERRAAGKAAQGVVTLSARHEQNHIVIEITDDGRGMDPARLKESALRKGMLTDAAAGALSDRDAVQLIFASGFSTAQTLTDISGRGVGMDIVKSNLEKLGGRILVESAAGMGSRFTIHLPLTLAIVRAILVEAGGGTYVLPLGHVVEMLHLGTTDEGVTRQTLAGQAVINLRGRTVPLANLSDLLCGLADATGPERIAEEAFVVVVGVGEAQIGLCVDALVGEQEVVIKSLGTLLGDISGLSGATILGDGRVALIVDVAQAVNKIRAGAAFAARS